MLTPRDIHEAEFRRVLKGYSPEEVDRFLHRVVTEYEKVYQENQRLKKQAQQLEEQLEEYSKTEVQLSLTLDLARQTADDLKEAAKKEADAVLMAARAEADDLRHQATLALVSRERRLDEYVDEIRRYRNRLLEDLDQLTRYLSTLDEPSAPELNVDAGTVVDETGPDFESDHNPADEPGPSPATAG